MISMTQESKGELGVTPTVHNEHFYSGALSFEDAEFLANYPEKDKQRVLRKVFRIIISSSSRRGDADMSTPRLM